jgi:hypothetical protein
MAGTMSPEHDVQLISDGNVRCVCGRGGEREEMEMNIKTTEQTVELQEAGGDGIKSKMSRRRTKILYYGERADGKMEGI